MGNDGDDIGRTHSDAVETGPDRIGRTTHLGRRGSTRRRPGQGRQGGRVGRVVAPRSQHHARVHEERKGDQGDDQLGGIPHDGRHLRSDEGRLLVRH